MQGLVGESLKTRFFMPCWWVKAFESSFRVEKKLNSWSEILDQGFSPQFNAAEAGLLPTLFTSIQSQLFDADFKNQVIISPDQVEKQAGFFPDSRKKTLQKVFMGLGGSRLYQKGSGGEFLSLPLFQKESWEQESDSSFNIHLQLTREGRELVSGFLDGYEDLNRALRGEPVLDKIAGPHPPLMLWRPLWYELQGVEQAVLLNIEKATQWEQSCFNLDGVFGEQVSKLFAFEAQNEDSGIWGLKKKLQFLAKLTRKLTEHGSLVMLSEKESCVFTDQEPGLQFLWKINPDRFPGMEYGDYTDSVYSLHESDKPASSVVDEPWLQYLLRDADLKSSGELNVRYQEIQELVAKKPLRSRYIVEKGNKLIPLTKLYIEWVLRQQHSHRHGPIPVEIRNGIGNKLPKADSGESEWRKGFLDFLDFVHNYRPFLRGGPHQASLSIAGHRGPEEFLKAIHQPDLSSEIRTYESGRGGLLTDQRTNSDDQSGIGEEKPVSTEKIKAVAQTQGAEGTSDGSVVVPDKKLKAVEKVEKLQKSDRDTYLSLIEEYLRSLDDSARQLISDIRERMQPDIFEQHMQHRLVRFVLQDDERWLS